jgi:hypothetical protein
MGPYCECEARGGSLYSLEGHIRRLFRGDFSRPSRVGNNLLSKKIADSFTCGFLNRKNRVCFGLMNHQASKPLSGAVARSLLTFDQDAA